MNDLASSPIGARVRQIEGRFAYIKLAGDYIGDQASAVFAETSNLITDIAYSLIDLRSDFINVLAQCVLLNTRWNGHWKTP